MLRAEVEGAALLPRLHLFWPDILAAIDGATEALAGRLGVSSQSVFRWETGRSKPSRLATSRLETLRAKAAGKRRRHHKEAS